MKMMMSYIASTIVFFFAIKSRSQLFDELISGTAALTLHLYSKTSLILLMIRSLFSQYHYNLQYLTKAL